MRKKLIYFLLFFGFFPLQAHSQLLIVDLYNLEDGLSNSRVQALAIEPNGLLWIGTSDGLTVFNGIRFQSFRNQPLDFKSLCDNRIQSLCVSSDNDIWIGTRNGMSLFEKEKGTFLNFFHDNQNPNTISDNNVLGIFEDRRNNLWIQTPVSLDLFDKKSNRFLHYYPFNDFFHFVTSRISSITEDENGDIWIATKDGLNRFDRHLNLFERFSPQNGYPELGSPIIQSIFKSKRGDLWVGTERALCLYNKSSKKFKRLWPKSSALNQKSSVISITEDKGGFIWVVTSDGLQCYDNKGILVKSYNSLSWRNTQQSFLSLNAILCDNSNMLWMASNLGLAKYDLKKQKFNILQKTSSEKIINDITALFLDNHNMWMGTRENGIIKLDINTGKTADFSKKQFPISSIDRVSVNQILETRNKFFIVGTENGLFVRKLNESLFVDACKTAIKTECRANIHHRIHKVKETPDGRILVATEQGLHVFSPNFRQLQNISTFINGNTAQPLGEIYSVAIENEHEVWVGTKFGLVKLNLNTRNGQSYQIASKIQDKNSGENVIFDIYDDLAGKLWLATSGGLAVCNKKTGEVFYVENDNGLVYSYIYAILNDANGNLWLSSNKGIIKYNIRTNIFNSFNISDGLQGYEFNPGAAIKSSNGVFYFGGLSGVNYFSPDSLEYNTYKPKMLISSFDIIKEGKRQPVYITGKLNQKIVLHRSVSSFSIDFAALDYSNVSKNNYAYRLIRNGKETNWIDHQNRTSVSFTNLTPGLYQFEVKGCNNDGVWTDNPASLIIEIKSPWWVGVYAIIFYVILLISIAIFFIQIRTYNLRKSNRLLREKEIAARKIEKQREELAVQNKNIRDSINYAKRLQEALMPSEKIVRKYLPNSFVFHRPKDIVSGDFFWVSNYENRLVLAAVDCTGHGVPGAFMSIIGYELFRKITSMHPFKSASELLQLLTNEFICIFKDIEDFSMHDGMDVSLCCIDLKTNIIEFAGAFNPLYYVRSNKIEEVKGNRFSVSIRSNKEMESVGFSNHQIQAQPGDIFYIFSDGYADQFGGSEGKKFKYRRFRHLLLSIHQLSFAEQKSYLSESIDLWKGNLEQVDDVLVIGFKLL